MHFNPGRACWKLWLGGEGQEGDDDDGRCERPSPAGERGRRRRRSGRTGRMRWQWRTRDRQCGGEQRRRCKLLAPYIWFCEQKAIDMARAKVL